MTAAIAFALGALLANGLFDLVYKRAAQAGVPAHYLVMAQAWCFTAFMVLYGAASGTLRFEAQALWGAVAGLFLFAGLYNFARSLQSGSVSINAPIFRMNFLVTALLAVVLLGESVSATHAIGLALAIVAAWLLLRAPAGADGARRISTGSLARVGFATASMGIANLVYKLGVQAGATGASLLTAQAAVFVTLATLRVRRIEGAIRPTRAIMGYGAMAAAMLALGLLLLLAALRRGEASVVVPIAQMGFVVSAAAGFVFLKERFSMRAALGLAVAVGALGSLALG
jgi:uncharacterized membrane protein